MISELLGWALRLAVLYAATRFALFLLVAAFEIDNKSHADIRNEIHWQRPFRSDSGRQKTSYTLQLGGCWRFIRRLMGGGAK